nr:hypothetical protein MACL_00002278 [Theileria orientalis]
MNTPSDLLKLATDAVKYSEKSVENLVDYYSSCKNSGDFRENVSKKALYVIDDISNTLCSIADPSEFLRHVHENDEWRKVANECIEIISDFIGKININKKIYEILINDKSDLSKDEELVLSHMIESMKSQGVHLSELPQIEYLKLLKEELMLSYSIFELSSKNQHPYNQILKNAENPDFRKQVWLSQRKSNQESLLKILELRDTRTRLSQIRGFADYREYAQNDLEELWKLNSKSAHNKNGTSLNPWDIDYLVNLKRNENIIFLSLKTLIDYFKYLLKELFNIELTEDDIKQESLWDDKIIKYNLVHDNRTVANLYLDLFERESKTTMCAQFTIRCSKTYSKVDKNGEKYISKIMNPRNYEEHEDKLIQIPSTVVTTSFTSGGIAFGREREEKEDKGKGMKFNDIKIDLHNCEIIFHELGHTLHTLLSKTELQHLSGNRGPIDYAEFSSHLFELFFQNHVVEMMKLEGINETFNEKDVMYYKKFESVDLARMIISSQIDQRFYDDKYKYDWMEIENGLNYKDIFQNYKNYFNEKYEKWKNDEEKWNGKETVVTLLGPIAITNFDHLIHYGGNYYCYLYSRILAIKAYKSFKNKSYKEIGSRLLEFFKKEVMDNLDKLTSCVSRVLKVCFSGTLVELKESIQKLLEVDDPELNKFRPKLVEKVKSSDVGKSTEAGGDNGIQGEASTISGDGASVGVNSSSSSTGGAISKHVSVNGDDKCFTSSELSALEFIRDSKKHCVAHIAASGGNLEVLKTLLTSLPNLARVEDENGENSLFYSIRSLSDHGEADGTGVSDSSTKMECLMLLIGHSGVNSVNKEGVSALHAACELGDVKTVKALIERSANVNLYCDQLGTPLNVSVARGYHDVFELLLNNGADPNVTASSSNGRVGLSVRRCPPPIVFASSTGQLEIVKKLLDKGADPNLADYEGWTALHCASELGYLEIVKLLVLYKANPNIKTEDKNAYYLAVYNGHVEVAEYLKQYTNPSDVIEFIHTSKDNPDSKDEHSGGKLENKVELKEEELNENEKEEHRKLVHESKNEGNRLVKLQDYENATKEYTKALSLCPIGPNFNELRSILYSNRSFTNLKLKRYEEALEDSKQSIKLNPSWSKAYLRMANVYRDMGEIVDYLHNLFQAFVKDSENTELKNLFQKEFSKYRAS